MTEANFSFTTKINGDLFTIRGNSTEEFASNLQSVTPSLGALLASATSGANAGNNVGTVLGATPVDSPQQQEAPPEFQQPQPPAPQGGQQPWNPAQQPGDPWAQSQPQQPQPPAQQGGQWGQPSQAPQGWAQQPSAGGAEAWKLDPTIQPPMIQPPQTPWGPATYKGGISKKTNKPYRMWVDPRPWGQIKDLPDSQKFASVFIRDNDLGI